LAEPPGARSAIDFRAAVEAADIDAVVVATPHAELSAIAIACLDAGKHVLLEKPGGISPKYPLSGKRPTPPGGCKGRLQSPLPSGCAEGA